jgi:hypothetical protein
MWASQNASLPPGRPRAARQGPDVTLAIRRAYCGGRQGAAAAHRARFAQLALMASPE